MICVCAYVRVSEDGRVNIIPKCHYLIIVLRVVYTLRVHLPSLLRLASPLRNVDEYEDMFDVVGGGL